MINLLFGHKIDASLKQSSFPMILTKITLKVPVPMEIASRITEQLFGTKRHGMALDKIWHSSNPPDLGFIPSFQLSDLYYSLRKIPKCYRYIRPPSYLVIIICLLSSSPLHGERNPFPPECFRCQRNRDPNF